MYNLDFSDTEKHVHFIGIGGISMSTLAELLIDRGFKVSGSDSTPSPITDSLSAMGAVINIGQVAEKNGKSVEELLTDLEEKQTALDANTAVTNQSVGPQSKNTQEFFDPAGTEFLKGLWGK